MFLNKNKEHSLISPAIIGKHNYNSSIDNFYYINGNQLSYNDWLKHPGKIRHDRNNKLNLRNHKNGKSNL